MNKIKGIIIPILIITMIFFVNPTKEYAVQNNIKIGDINNDGVIDSRDTLRMLEHIAASTISKIGQKHPNWILKDDKLKAGDINSDGVIDSRDILRELEYIAASTIPKIATKHPEWKTYIEKKWTIEATEIKLDKTDMTIYKGKIGKINATISPTNATDKTVKWSSSNTQVATVDGLGNVEGKSKGISIITATTSNGKKATCKVTVNNLSVAVTSVSLNKTALTMNRGNSTAITANVKPTYATNKTIKWSSSNNNIAIVSNGKITAKKAGTVIITATTSNGKKATCKVTVNPIIVNSIKLKQVDRTIAVGASLQLNAIITPTNADNKTITWSSSDSKIAQVTKTGVVKGLKVGKVTITAKTANNKKATCIIRVNIPAKSISLDKTNVTMSKGNTSKLTVTFNPTNTSSKTITWKSSNTNVATVNNKGEVKAIAKGTAVITATSAYGRTATCRISVVETQGTFDLKHAIKVTARPHAKEHEYLKWHGGTVGGHAGMICAYVDAINILNNTDYTLKQVYDKIISAHPEQKSKNKPVYENKDINNYYHISVSRAPANISEVKKALSQGKIVADIANTTKWRNEKGNLFGKTGQHTGLIFYYDGKYYHMKTSVKLNAIYTESQLIDWLRDTKDKLIIYSKKN